MPLADTRDPNSLSSRLRGKRDVKVRALIQTIFREKGKVSIIDVGGTVEYWNRMGLDFLREHNVRIALVNLLESELSDLADASDIMTNIVGNGCDLYDIADNSFDLAHSNSVIEHVGGWQNMKAFAHEMRRVAVKYYLQTPYYWFVIDPHFYKMPFYHWLPRPLRRYLLSRFPLAYSGRLKDFDRARATVESAVLLDKSEAHFLFPDANIQFERFYGLKKSIIAIRK